jgi:peptidoglycan-associated lipoprotein
MKLLGKLFLVLTVLISSYTYSQTKNYAKEAENLWASGMYEEAADAYKKASEKMSVKNVKAKDKKASYAYLSAECYRLIHKFPQAEEQYEKSILLGYQEKEPIVHFHLAEMQMAQGNHKKAEGNYKKYNELNPVDPLTEVRIQSCKDYSEFKKNKTRHEMTQMTKLNTTEFDYAAKVNARGTEMYFTSSRSAATGEEKDAITGQDFTDIFVTTIDRKGNFGEPVPLPESINTIDNEGAACFDGRGKTMWFTRCSNEEKMNLGCDIYMVTVKNNKYGEPVKLNLKDHDSTHVGHPAASSDGKTLVFASNMTGGEGGVDLWMVTYNKRDDSWSLPVNLGPDVNTPGNEVFPTFAEDGSLYYSSNGLVGAGGLDIFKATKLGEENKWNNPTNMGAPLNTYADDYHLIFTQNDDQGQRGYLSSNRAGSKGPRQNPSQDIWSFYLPPVLVDLMITVLDQETGDPLPDMEVKIVGSDGVNYVLKTDTDGQLNLSEKEDLSRYINVGHDFTVEVTDIPGIWLGNKDNFSTKDISVSRRIIREITVMNVEKPIRLPEVQYPLGSAELLVDSTKNINSKDSLNFLYDIMIEHPNLVIKLLAHTDSRGSAAANQKLSQERAESCVRYLVDEKGIPENRFVPKGAGENIPTTIKEIDPETGEITVIKLTEKYINSFKSKDKDKFEMLHQKNRRTEGEIIGTEYIPTITPESEVPEGGE